MTQAHDDAADYLDAPIARPASPFASVSSTNGLPPRLALVDPIQILRRFPHRILVEEPPAFGENLRRIVQGLSIPHQPHTTFGLVSSTIFYPVSKRFPRGRYI
ncbi:hypothetical protein BGY98DRAFT_1052744 [Russula aff. rugulosa BPL654]|nr:hypothetical protein BGY98DRAFT_1052744 [Russula aff. rugulosa BPL654]